MLGIIADLHGQGIHKRYAHKGPSQFLLKLLSDHADIDRYCGQEKWFLLIETVLSSWLSNRIAL